MNLKKVAYTSIFFVATLLSIVSAGTGTFAKSTVEIIISGSVIGELIPCDS